MDSFKLEPVDILVRVNNCSDPIPGIKRWALGSSFDHIFMYLGKLGLFINCKQDGIMRLPMLFESSGRGYACACFPSDTVKMLSFFG